MVDAGKGHDGAVGLVEVFQVGSNCRPVDFVEPLLRTQQWIAERVVFIPGNVDELGQDQFRLGPDLANLVIGRLELLFDFFVCQ